MSEVTPGEDTTDEPRHETADRSDDAPDDTPGDAPADAPADAPEGDDDQLPACLCPLSGVLDLLSKKYAMQVVCAVGVLGPVRYRDLSDQLGSVSSSTLSTRLEELTEADILAREQYDEIPPRVEYRLTEDGEELAARLEPVVEWAQNR